MPYFQAKDQLVAAGAIVRSSNYELYADLSQRMMQPLPHLLQLPTVATLTLTLTPTLSPPPSEPHLLQLPTVVFEFGTPFCVHEINI